MVRPATVATVVAALAALALVVLAAAAAPASAEPDAEDPPKPATPCTATAKACVDLTTQKAWLLDNGAVTYGPIPVSSGGPGKETPIGTFKVQWKNRNHVSTEQAGTPMPYAVFFADGGIALHGGDVERASAGCVHLDNPDAIVFYDTLKLGDQVQVRASTPGSLASEDDEDAPTRPSAPTSSPASAAPASSARPAPRPSTRPSAARSSTARPSAANAPAAQRSTRPTSATRAPAVPLLEGARPPASRGTD